MIQPPSRRPASVSCVLNLGFLQRSEEAAAAAAVPVTSPVTLSVKGRVWSDAVFLVLSAAAVMILIRACWRLRGGATCSWAVIG